jgi:aspartate aminotransferase-like enzyme
MNLNLWTRCPIKHFKKYREGIDKLVASDEALAEIENEAKNKYVTENNDKCDIDKNTLTEMPLEEFGESVTEAETLLSTCTNANFDGDDFAIDEYVEKEQTKIFRKPEAKTSFSNTGVCDNEIYIFGQYKTAT